MYCCKCNMILRMHTSKVVTLEQKSYYESNLGAVLGQIATGGGGNHLQEQLSSMNIPPLSPQKFIQFEKDLGIAFESLVTQELLAAGQEEYKHAIATNTTFEGVPACTVVVDGGWSKRSHKHSYNAKSGVGVIFGAQTKKLLFIGIHNKYCCTCAIANRKSIPVPPHHCFKNWSQSSCSMESDIIVEGFKRSEAMHGLRYMWMIGDGDSSVHLSVSICVPYGRSVQKVECANHAIKCFRSGLEKLAKEHVGFGGKQGLTGGKIQHLSRRMKCAIKQHSSTKDIEALRHDLCNCPHHCFGDHRKCSPSFCKNAGRGDGGMQVQRYMTQYRVTFYTHIKENCHIMQDKWYYSYPIEKLCWAKFDSQLKVGIIRCDINLVQAWAVIM